MDALADEAVLEGESRGAFPYRPDIDGLRAVAVVAVFLFHLGFSAISGGFVGVDVFFVISGYLIMSTILADMARGSFTIAHFYDRRIRRILPALVVVSALCVVVSIFMATPEEMRRLGEQLVAMGLFVSNIFFRYAGSAQGYFAAGDHPDLLLHTWSLSVEEQFYILMPAGLLLLARRKAHTMRWLVGCCLVSFVLSVVWTEINQKEAFYLVFTRAWELLVGSILALAPAPRLGGKWREALGAIGVATIVAAVLLYSDATPFPGAAAAIPCGGALLVILAGQRRLGLAGRLLASPPFVRVGRLSYSLYLWHWPVIVLVKRVMLGELTWAATVFVVVVASLGAYLSWRFVERPFRRPRPRLTERRVLWGGALASGLTAAIGLMLVASDGLALRVDPGTRAVLAANAARETDNVGTACGNWKRAVRTVDDIDTCPTAPERPKQVLLMGDSHILMLRPVIKALSEANAFGDRGVIFALSAGCPPAPDVTRPIPGYHCNAFARLAMVLAARPDVDTVLIGFSAGWDGQDGALCAATDDVCSRSLTSQEADARVMAGLSGTLRRLKAEGKRVIVRLPSPIYNWSVPQYQINQITLAGLDGVLRRLGALEPLRRDDHQALRRKIVALAAMLGAEVYDPRKELCGADGRCLYERGGVSLYSDTDHIATGQSFVHADALRAALAPRDATPIPDPQPPSQRVGDRVTSSPCCARSSPRTLPGMTEHGP